MLARMERDGLITRQRSDEDARRSVVSATAAGLALTDALSQAIEADYLDLEAHLGKAKLAQLYRLLDELIALQEETCAEESLEASA